VLVPDMSTLRLVPWHEATALVLCDVQWTDGAPVVASPRQILRAQLDRLATHGLAADVGTELEFMVFADSFDAAWRKGYHGLEPANLYNVDYSMLGTARVEPLLRRIRNGMAGAGMASATSASTRSRSATPTRSPRATTTPSTRRVPRRSPTRPAWR
jgi:glutamine synthetase